MAQKGKSMSSIRIRSLGVSAYLALADALLAAVTLVGFCIYGAIYNEYFDLAVAALLLLGIICMAGYALIDTIVTEYINVAGVFCVSFSMGLFFLNSYEVWADWYGNFDMYGSRGGLTPVIILLVLHILTIVCGIVSCFIRKEGDKA